MSVIYSGANFQWYYFSWLPIFSQAWVANFERPRMNANSLLASPTGLSPYLRFGCLSCRLFYFKLTDLYRKVRMTTDKTWTNTLLLLFVMVMKSNQPILQMMNLNHVTFVFSTLSGQEEQHPTSFLVWPAAVEGVLLYDCHQQPLLWQDRGKPCLCPDPLGQKPRGAGQVGRGTDGLSLDRRHYDPAKAGGMDPSLGEACCGLLPYQGRPLDQLGGRHEGTN